MIGLVLNRGHKLPQPLINNMSITENEKPIIADRATEIESGATHLQSSNVLLGLPEKPDPMQSCRTNALASNWTFAQLLGQKKLIATINFGQTQPADRKIWSFQHTMNNVVDLHFRSVKGLFKIWRWTLHFLFEFRSNFQQVGHILVVNHTMPANYAYNILGKDFVHKNYRAMTQLPHQKVFMGEDTDVECTLKWNAPIEGTIGIPGAYDMIDDKGKKVDLQPYDMGEVFVIAPFPMEVATNVYDQLTLRVWSWLSDVGMSAYSPEDIYL